MSGHNKWSSIKHKKQAVDSKRGKVFTKIIKEITVAARIGGGDTSSNARLRLAVTTARNQNMPKDNIEKAIKRGTGELTGVEYSECIFEGYGPNGVAILVEGMTDNINRTAADIRAIFNKNHGNFGAQGSVSWIFESKGLILIEKDKASEEQLMEVAVSAGADDIIDRHDHWELATDPNQFEAVRNALEGAKISMASAEITKIAKNTVKLSLADSEKLMQLVEKLEDSDDVQKVHGNYEIPDEIMEKIA